MCLYLALGLFWLGAAFSDKYRNTAVLTTIFLQVDLLLDELLVFLQMANLQEF